MQAYHYTEVEELPVEGCPGVTIRWAMAQNVEAPNFYARIIAIAPGGATEYHEHPWEHQVVVLAGEGAVRDADGELTAVGEGSCVYVESGEVHQFRNTGDEVLRFVCVIPKPEAK